MKIGETFQNFRVTNVREFPELEGKLWEMEHIKTGAQLVWLDRPDENKTFGIAFKTIPTDSTGVFHILEHSVLCGSDKFPVKEPFVELLKSSVQTFLNAMTYPDKTVYPISSRNDQDFLNLLDVYMDAVLHPAIYHKPEIFRQEGWRYELQGENTPIYQGVVFNEMKGAYSSSDTVLEYAMNQLMFPDNCYSWESGGHPEYIPDLSYEQFIASHQKYYHPSNARIMLVGSVNLNDALAHIDGYLKDYERQSADFPIAMQQPVPYTEARFPYEIGTEEDPTGRTIISNGFMLGDYSQKEKLFAAMVLHDYLAGDNDAPLKQAILSKGLGQDLKLNLHAGIQQNWISWEVWNTDEEKIDDIKAAVNGALTDLAEKGLDQERLRACFNRFAFRLRDKDGGWAPRSLSEGLDMLDSWLYGGDPALYLLVEDTLNSLEAKLETAYYADLVKELFLENPHHVMAVLYPSQTLGAEKLEKEAKRVESEYTAWTEADHAHYAKQEEILKTWQLTPDSPEALATIPMLKLSDLDPTPERIEAEVTEEAGVTVLKHNIHNGLTYLNLHFDASHLTAEELSVAALLRCLLGKLPTAKFNSAQLQMQVKQKIGKLNFTAAVYAGKTTADCDVRLAAETVCLESQNQAALELVCQILTQTNFHDIPALRNLLKQNLMRLQQEIVGAGHQYGILRAGSFLSAAGAVKETMKGSTFINWLKEKANADDAALEELATQLEKVAKKVFTVQNLTVSVSAGGADLAKQAIVALPAGEKAAKVPYAPAPLTQVGLPIPAAVGFAVKASNQKNHGGSFDGSTYVLANILRFSYLWSEIRVQGGAYGCGFSGREDGDVYFHSYRDPQPDRSLGVYDRAADFIREFCAQTADLTPMIIGAMADADPLLNTTDRMGVAEIRFFKGTTYADLCRIRKELVETTPEKLLSLLPMLENLVSDNAVCVVAGQNLLDRCGDQLAGTEQVL